MVVHPLFCCKQRQTSDSQFSVPAAFLRSDRRQNPRPARHQTRTRRQYAGRHRYHLSPVGRRTPGIDQVATKNTKRHKKSQGISAFCTDLVALFALRPLSCVILRRDCDLLVKRVKQVAPRFSVGFALQRTPRRVTAAHHHNSVPKATSRSDPYSRSCDGWTCNSQAEA